MRSEVGCKLHAAEHSPDTRAFRLQPRARQFSTTTGHRCLRSHTRRTTREELLHLLTEAAEFEHNLLCCYLYAAFSLKRDDTLSGPEREAVDRWHKSITAVAIEEMTHLALVATLTVADGARPHFNRPNLPVPAGYHPGGIVIELAPFDMGTLEHFIFLERPQDCPVEDGAGFEQDGDYDRGRRPGAALMPAATDSHSRLSLRALLIHQGGIREPPRREPGISSSVAGGA